MIRGLGARGWGVAFGLSLSVVGCGSPPPPAYPGELLPVSALGRDRLVRQRIEGARGEQRWEADVVLQKRGDTLLLLGLTPFGTRMFAIEERGDGEVQVTSFVDAELPFPPRFVLLDVQRALFMGIGGGPLSDGRHEVARGGERIVERWREGALLERSFERLDGHPAGWIRVEYGEGMRDGVPPPIMHLDNEWLGYRLTIETISERPL